MSKILIVEDEESIAELEKDYLELSGFEVEIENDGEAGLKRAISEEFDLFILDLMLPGVDGFEICKKIRETKNTPVIMISAKKDDIDKIRGLGLGADDYITKPFSPSEMVARVKAHLSRYERLIGSGTPVNDIIEIRGLKIDKTARRVYVNGEELEEDYAEGYTEGDVYMVIPQGCVFVMGDNREKSIDSRYFGVISTDNIYGRVLMRFFPLNEIEIFK